MSDPQLPVGFRWGVATSAYQIEGATRAGGRGPSIWDTFTHEGDHVADGTSGDEACEHYARFRQDEDAPAADGSVDHRDRIAYLAGHIDAVRAARAEGVPVRGYFVWSLLDNFEWAEGFTTRFGLVHVDFATQRRTPKASYEWYRILIDAENPPPRLPIKE